MLERVAVTQRSLQLGERRARRVRANGDPHVVSHQPHREGAAAVARARGRVQREHVERHGVAGLERPAEDRMGGAIRLDVGHLLEGALVEDERAIVEEAARHVPRARSVGAGHELERALTRHGVEWDPKRHGVEPVDVVVGLILVPGRPDRRARLLHEQVVVVQADHARAHQPCGDLAETRAADDLPVVRDAGPVAEVLEEAARAGVAAALDRALARLGQVALDGPAKPPDLGIVEQTPYYAAAPSRWNSAARRTRSSVAG